MSGTISDSGGAPGPVLERHLCQVVGLNQNYVSAAGTLVYAAGTTFLGTRELAWVTRAGGSTRVDAAWMAVGVYDVRDNLYVTG